MESRLLEPAERQRFVRYCRENAASCDAIANKMDEMPTMPGLASVANYNRTRAMAYSIVANDLDMVEDVTLHGSADPAD